MRQTIRALVKLEQWHVAGVNDPGTDSIFVGGRKVRSPSQ